MCLNWFRLQRPQHRALNKTQKKGREMLRKVAKNIIVKLLLKMNGKIGRDENVCNHHHYEENS